MKNLIVKQLASKLLLEIGITLAKDVIAEFEKSLSKMDKGKQLAVAMILALLLIYIMSYSN